MSLTHLLSPIDIIFKILEYYGHNAEAILFKAGIDREMILKPGARISHTKVERFWAKIIGLIKDPCFGLYGSKFWHPSHFNALGYAWLASSTLREAINRASRYAHIVGEDRETRVEDKPEGLSVTLSDSLKLPALMDLSMSILLSACRVNYGNDLDPVAVYFIHSKPSCANEYYSFFNAPVEFNADRDSLILPASAVDKLLPIGNPQLAKINDQYIIRYLARLNDDNIVQSVKGRIIEMLPSGEISDEKVAKKLNLSTRSLQRKLHTVHTSFRALLDEVRQELAEIYVHDSNINLIEIPFVLGYSDYSSFSRAYKRWTEVSPSDTRKSAQNKY